MSEKIKISVVMDDEKPNAKKREDSGRPLVLTQEADMTIMSVLLANCLMDGSFCGGRGDCGRCVVQFLEGAPLPTGLERARLTPEELRQGCRLACIAKPKRDCTVKILSGSIVDIPTVTEVNLPSENIDLNSQENNLSKNQKPSAMKYEKENECYIIAVDLGTTTIAMQLRDMMTGECADTYCEQNPQRRYGADVLSRIEASCSGRGEELQKLVCESLLRGLRQFTAYLWKRQGGEPQILCMCIAGNTVMEHLLLGYDVEGLGKAPFVPARKGLQRLSASSLFSEISMDFPVYAAPCISAFVGGDVVAGLYALRMLPMSLQGETFRRGAAETAVPPDTAREENRRTTLLIDLGTNGEMAITDGQRMIVTATAAGPAFEGRGDLIGTDRIALTEDLLRRGILDETGLMAEPCFEKGVRVEREEKSECYFKQEDVRALQMAKAAVRAGVEILWEEMGRPEIGQVYLAGGFGYYLDVEAAFAIGLLPSNMRGRVRAVGNTSLAGAYELGRALSIEGTVGEIWEKKLSEIESMNLAEKEKFEKLYLKYMNLEEN